MHRLRLVGVVVALCVTGGCSNVPIESLPAASEVIESVGRRLGESLSIRRLAEFQGRGDKVLAALTRRERWELGRNLVRFRLARPGLVTVAAPEGAEPFWLRDQGFARVDGRVVDELGVYTLHERRFPPGWVGLGVSALDDRAPAHYAVFVDAPIEPHRANPPSEPSSFRDLPDGLRSVASIRPRQSDRTASALVTARVWKSRRPSRPKPDQVVVSFGEDAATTLGFNWRTRPETFGSVVEVAREGRESVRVEGTSEIVRSFGLLNDPTIRRHRASVSGFPPGATLRYRVGDGSERGWSDWRTTRTGPGPGAVVRLMYMGDAQCGLEGWGTLLRNAVSRHPNVAAILLAGDLVDRGNERSNWDHFFLRAEGVFDRVPFMPAVGNHEYLDRGPVHHRASFTTPENGPEGIDPRLVYTFEIGDAFVAVLDSNLAKYDARSAKVQASWLEERAKRSKAAWRLVMFHHPVHASHPTRENPELAEAWTGVFERLEVDLVLQGHDHAYLRTAPMRGGRPLPDGEYAPVYLVTVSGDKYCDQDPRGYARVGFTNVSTYQLLDFDPARGELLYRAFDAEGVERDRLSLSKRPKGEVASTGGLPVK